MHSMIRDTTMGTLNVVRWQELICLEMRLSKLEGRMR
jgi:hypothetical protein